MIFSIYMLIKYMLSLELNSKLEFRGLTMGKVRGIENFKKWLHIGIILKDSSESYFKIVPMHDVIPAKSPQSTADSPKTKTSSTKEFMDKWRGFMTARKVKYFYKGINSKWLKVKISLASSICPSDWLIVLNFVESISRFHHIYWVVSLQSAWTDFQTQRIWLFSLLYYFPHYVFSIPTSFLFRYVWQGTRFKIVSHSIWLIVYEP